MFHNPLHNCAHSKKRYNTIARDLNFLPSYLVLSNTSRCFSFCNWHLERTQGLKILDVPTDNLVEYLSQLVYLHIRSILTLRFFSHIQHFNAITIKINRLSVSLQQMNLLIGRKMKSKQKIEGFFRLSIRLKGLVLFLPYPLRALSLLL